MFSLHIDEGKTQFLFVFLFNLTLAEFPLTFLSAITTIFLLRLPQQQNQDIPARRVEMC